MYGPICTSGTRLTKSPGKSVNWTSGITNDFVLFVSTIEPRKNLATLLNAFRKLLDVYHPQVCLKSQSSPRERP